MWQVISRYHLILRSYWQGIAAREGIIIFNENVATGRIPMPQWLTLHQCTKIGRHQVGRGRCYLSMEGIEREKLWGGYDNITLYTRAKFSRIYSISHTKEVCSKWHCKSQHPTTTKTLKKMKTKSPQLRNIPQLHFRTPHTQHTESYNSHQEGEQLKFQIHKTPGTHLPADGIRQFTHIVCHCGNRIGFG